MKTAFDYEDESETPRTHIQAFLSNAGTNPSHILSSKAGRRSRSFVKTPAKESKSKAELRAIRRMSTTFPPSPDSQLTPRSNIRHFLLGGLESAKTPLKRRVVSARSTRSHSKLISPEADSRWGQKVSLSPVVYSASPSSDMTNAESSKRGFKPTMSRRSFHIPDPPAKAFGGGASSLSREIDGGIVVPEQESSPAETRPEVDANSSGSNSDLLENFTQKSSSSHHSKDTVASQSIIHVLEQMSKSIVKEKATRVYELTAESSDEDLVVTRSSLSSAKKRLLSPNRSRTAYTPSKKRLALDEDVSVEGGVNRSTGGKQDTPAASTEVVANKTSSHLKSQVDASPPQSVENAENDNFDDNENTPSVFKPPEIVGLGTESTEKLTPLDKRVPVRNRTTRSSSSSTGTNPLRSVQSSRTKRKSVPRESLSVSKGHFSASLSSSKRLKSDNLDLTTNGDSSNPSSSTPFKRSKSAFSFTKMQASVANDLASTKNASSHNQSMSESLGSISPIRPSGEEHGQNVEGPDFVATANDKVPREISSNETNLSRKSAISPTPQTSQAKERSEIEPMFDEEDDEDEEEEDGIPTGLTPMRTPVLDWNKRPQPMRSTKVSATIEDINTSLDKVNEEPVKKKKAPVTSMRKRPSVPTTILPRRTVKFFSELYSSMKIDREAIDELEEISQQFFANMLESLESFCLHAGRKVINEADCVLLMKRQKLIKTNEDLYDLIREFLPMELRCELIPCFPSQK